MGPLSMSAKQHREYLKLQSQEQREQAKMQAEQQRKQQLHEIKLQEAAAKAKQGIGHKENIHAVKLNEMGSPLGKAPRMNKQKLGIPSQNPLAGTGVLNRGQKKLYAEGTDTVPAMLTPGEAVIPAPAAQNPENKPIIKAMVEEGREKNNDMGVPKQYSQGTADVKYYYDGTEYAMYGDTGYGPLDVNLQVPQVEYPAVQVADANSGRRPGWQVSDQTLGTSNFPGWIPPSEIGPAFVAPKQGRRFKEPIQGYELPTPETMAQFAGQESIPKVPINANVPLTPAQERQRAAIQPNQTVAVPVNQPVAVVPFSNPNANQTTTLKPVNDIEAIDSFDLTSMAESRNNPNAKNPLSSARGLLGYTKDTWNGVRKQVPELANVEFGSEEFASKEAQRLAYNHTKTQNDAILEKQRIPVTNVNRYVMHGLGSGDGARVLANPQGDFRETLNQSSRKGNADLIIKQNPVYTNFKTNQDYVDWAEGHLKRSAGIGRDSSVVPLKPINDPSQPAAVQVGTPEEFKGVPPIPVLETAPVSMIESDPKSAESAIADVAKQEHSNLDRLIAAIKASDAPPEVKEKEASTLIEKIYSDKGIFNQGDLIRFALLAAGGMLTGGSAAGSLKYASRDALMQSDARNRERIAAERQQKTIDAQNARQDKSLLTQAALLEARTLDAEKRADVKAARKSTDDYIKELVKEGRDPTEVRKWLAGGQKGSLPPIKQSFIRSGQNDLVTVTQPFMFEGKRIDPGTPMYQYNLKDPRTGDIQTMVRIGTKDVPLESAVASGIMLNKWDEGRHGPKAQVEDLQKWSDKSSKVFEEMMKSNLGTDDIKGRPNPARQGQVTPMQVQTQAASWAISKGYKINDPKSKLELEKINSIATKQAIKDMEAGSKVEDITPYLNASYIKQRSGLSDKLFELDPKKGTQMAPEKIVELRAKATKAGYADDAAMASEMGRLYEVWKTNANNIQRKYRDSASETAFYLYALEVMDKLSKNKK